MPNSSKKKPVNLDKKILDDFEYLYPDVKKDFIERALILATQDRSLFEKIFFNPFFVGVI